MVGPPISKEAVLEMFVYIKLNNPCVFFVVTYAFRVILHSELPECQGTHTAKCV